MDFNDFRFRASVNARWSDMDAFQHVNNARYLTYFEEARVAYLRAVIDWNPAEFGIIVASASVAYKAPLRYTDVPFIYVRCARLGQRRFDLEYVITDEQNDRQRVVAYGETVMVSYHYGQNQTVPVPEAVRAAFRQYEPHEPAVV